MIRKRATMGRIFFPIGFAAIVFLGTQVDARASDPIVTLRTRPDVTQSFVLLKPEMPVASVILFSGGPGKVPLDKLTPTQLINRGNFLVRARYEFRRHGLIVAIVDAPSDQQAGGMVTFRHGDEHAKDIGAVVDHLREIAAVPVWLIGTSRGTESVAALAIKLGPRIDGAILTSTITVDTRGGWSVLRLPLDSIRVPVLVVAHAGDECFVTPPADAERIRKALVKSPRAEARLFEGGDPPRDRDPCEALHAHGFLGIEKKVVAAIAEFVKGK